MAKDSWEKISMIFQEPMSSLNPVYKVGSQIMEMIHSHEKFQGKKLMNVPLICFVS